MLELSEPAHQRRKIKNGTAGPNVSARRAAVRRYAQPVSVPVVSGVRELPPVNPDLQTIEFDVWRAELVGMFVYSHLLT